ncbi:hypothetical protein D3C85_1484770 [compost metagenome]
MSFAHVAAVEVATFDGQKHCRTLDQAVDEGTVLDGEDAGAAGLQEQLRQPDADILVFRAGAERLERNGGGGLGVGHGFTLGIS